jgi:AcrR family transcriptional regulator
MGAVKSPPGSIRAERAAITRRRIADAARTLFTERGYGATTLRDVAEAAEVAVQTVYAVYGSKAEILRELRERIAMDPTADEAYSEALAAGGGGRSLDLFARSIRRRWEAGHDVIVVDAQAASGDPGIRVDRDRVLAMRRRGIDRLARVVVGGSDPQEVARAAAIIDAISLPEVYAELIDIHGWSPDDYEAWLAATLRRSVSDAREPTSSRD